MGLLFALLFSIGFEHHQPFLIFTPSGSNSVVWKRGQSWSRFLGNELMRGRGQPSQNSIDSSHWGPFNAFTLPVFLDVLNAYFVSSSFRWVIQGKLYNTQETYLCSHLKNFLHEERSLCSTAHKETFSTSHLFFAKLRFHQEDQRNEFVAVGHNVGFFQRRVAKQGCGVGIDVRAGNSLLRQSRRLIASFQTCVVFGAWKTDLCNSQIFGSEG